MYPGLSHDEIIEECLKELKHHFEVGPEVALISAEKGVQCVPFDESLQKKFPYFEGTYEVFDVPHTDFQIRYQPEQILAASGRKILTGTAFLCRRENERCLMLPSRYEKVDVEDKQYDPENFAAYPARFSGPFLLITQSILRAAFPALSICLAIMFSSSCVIVAQFATR